MHLASFIYSVYIADWAHPFGLPRPTGTSTKSAFFVQVDYSGLPVIRAQSEGSPTASVLFDTTQMRGEFSCELSEHFVACWKLTTNRGTAPFMRVGGPLFENARKRIRSSGV